jgi:cytochrome c oxidase subunit II
MTRLVSPHVTTRRGFVFAAGFSGVSLYGLWAAYGAAPGPMALLGAGHADGAPHGAAHDAGALAQQGAPAPAAAHGGHGAAAAGADPQQFLRESTAFSERWRLPDGRVHPRPPGPTHPAPSDAHAGHGAASPSMAAVHSDAPIDVLMAAGKWFYLPNALRLDVGQRYRFRMMALDIGHGASIQFGRGGRMMRLQPGRIAETELQFARAGRYLVYCTVYCGPAHDVMQASIEVA